MKPNTALLAETEEYADCKMPKDKIPSSTSARPLVGHRLQPVMLEDGTLVAEQSMTQVLTIPGTLHFGPYLS